MTRPLLANGNKYLAKDSLRMVNNKTTNSQSSGAPQRQDPLNEKYFVPLEHVDKISTVLFYTVAVLSVIVLFVDSKQHAKLNDGLNVAFFILTLILFALGLASRLYFAPRAEDARRQEFFATAFGVALTHERTVGYYNNAETEPVRRAAAQTLENAFFSKAIALTMLHRERGLPVAPLAHQRRKARLV